MRSHSELILAAALVTGAAIGGQGDRPAAASQPPPVAAGVPKAEASAPAPSPLPGPAYDTVGYALLAQATTAHPKLLPGSFVEVTALDSGRTALVPITATSAPGSEIALSVAVTQELGLAQMGRAAVRVRSVNASTADLAALQAGRATVGRADAPPMVLSALRRKLNETAVQAAPSAGPGPAATAAPAVPAKRAVRSAPGTTYPKPGAAKAPATSEPASTPAASPSPAPPVPVAASSGGPGYYVQIIALSDSARAGDVARSVGGQVSTAGRLHRVRLGPYPNRAGAQAARDAVAGRGYGDARIVRD